jgi:hypothetical protein
MSIPRAKPERTGNLCPSLRGLQSFRNHMYLHVSNIASG